MNRSKTQKKGNSTNTATPTNTSNMTSTNSGHDDTVLPGHAGSDDANARSIADQQMNSAPVNSQDLDKGFVSFQPQGRDPQKQDVRRPKGRNSHNSVGLVSESNIGADPYTRGSFRSKNTARNDEPVLMLYRRHSEDPFSMYDTISDVSMDSQGAGHSTVEVHHKVHPSPHKVHSSRDVSLSKQRDDVKSNMETVLSGLETGSNSRLSEDRSRSHAGQGDSHWRNEDIPQVSLNGIRLGVKKKPSSKKMVKMQSPRVQCCMCALSVMSALFGMFMLSAGVCLVLNYNFLEVDTSGLPPDLHNEEGKKVVGIILICVGIVALGVSALVSLLFYAACSRPATPSSRVAAEKGEGQGRPSSEESQGRQHGHGHYHSNGTTPVRAPQAAGTPGARRSAGAGAAMAMANGRRSNDPRGRGPAGKEGSAYSRNSVAGRNTTPPGSTRPYRPGKKNRHGQGRFRNSLPSHPEEASGEGAGESRHSARRLAFPDRQGHVNQAAQLHDDDTVVVSGNLATGAPEPSVTPSVVIKVDSSYLRDKATPSQPPSQEGESDWGAAVGADVAPSVTSDPDLNDNTVSAEEEGESGRVSRSTVASLDTAEAVEESPEEAQKRLDTQMNTLLS